MILGWIAEKKADKGEEAILDFLVTLCFVSFQGDIF
jgi:hypothetical protein